MLWQRWREEERDREKGQVSKRLGTHTYTQALNAADDEEMKVIAKRLTDSKAKRNAMHGAIN